ncbi:K homology domain-containing protein [Tanacetum coccineum]
MVRDAILFEDLKLKVSEVGVLIGKLGDTIQALQNSSAARVQITRDAEADPHSANSQGVPSSYYLRERKRQDVECVKSDGEVQKAKWDLNDDGDAVIVTFAGLEAYSWGQKVVSGIEAAWGAKKTEDETKNGWEHFLGIKRYNYMTCQYKSAADRAHDGSKTTHTQQAVGNCRPSC